MNIRNSGAGVISRTAVEPGGGVHPVNYEMLYILSGKVRFQWTEHVCDAEAPCVFLIPPSTPHQLESLSLTSNYYFVEIMHMEDIPLCPEEISVWNALQADNNNSAKNPIFSAVLDAVNLIHYLLSDHDIRTSPHLEQAILMDIRKILQLIAHLVQRSRNRSSTGNQSLKKRLSSEAINRAIYYMDWRYKETITLQNIADAAQLNPSYLVRSFKKHQGITPFEYLRNLRLKAAIHFLVRSNLSIGTIVAETGFGSIHYFCRAFKGVYGQSPGAWRNQYRLKPDMLFSIRG